MSEAKVMTPAERMKARGKVVDGFIRTAALPHQRAVRDYILKVETHLSERTDLLAETSRELEKAVEVGFQYDALQNEMKSMRIRLNAARREGWMRGVEDYREYNRRLGLHLLSGGSEDDPGAPAAPAYPYPENTDD